ncbi:maleylacetate reductase [Pseudonocardiaceae bacterium YIM PH 21723]|nr:maleylacetate reductase [Pseudonocardiaceae bacterium YIM PH 21723]
MHFTYDALPGRIVFGPGTARTALAAEIDRLGAERVLVIATGDRSPITDPISGRITATFTEVRPHVPVEVAEQARKAAEGADALLCIGGGSATGTAKAVALTTGLPIIAVPTTYAGSEVTPVWGMTEGSRKTTGTDRRVLPGVVVYDPELTATLPAELAAASGLNAMAHCVEAFWAAGRNPLSSVVAQEGIRALATGLAENDPENLLYGAYLAGAGFAVTGGGLHHRICHALGGAYNLPHAQTHAIVLPHVLAFNAPAAPDAAARIGQALGTEDPVAGLQDLATELGIPKGLTALGLREDQLDEAVGLITVPAENPRPVSKAELRELLHAAWEG